jgi:O-antigen/teichoic acid export membrane protein
MSQKQDRADEIDEIIVSKTDNLREQSIRGGAITLTTQAVTYGIQVASTVILARLLTPEDYGAVAMVAALTGFVSLFRDFGLSGAIVQSPSISKDQINALFWINAALGTLVMLAMMASAPLVASFYHRPELKLVTVGLSLTSFFNSLGTQHGALLHRQMRFKTLAYINLPALLAGFVAAVIVALSGGKYWALVANQVVAAIWCTAGLWIAAGFLPRRPRRGTGVRQFLRFGANILGFDLVFYVRDHVDQILVGRAWGAQQLGLYNRALTLLALPLANLRQPLNKVAFPAMSRLADNPERYRSYYIKYSSLLASVTMPLVAILYACSEYVIRLFLGAQWVGAAVLFKILALAGFVSAVASLRITIILSSGHGKKLLRWGILNMLVTVAAYLIGLPWGAKGVAIAYCVATYLALHPLLVYAVKDTPIRPADFYLSLYRPAIASIAMCVLYILTLKRFLIASDIVILALSVPFCLIIYLGIFCLMPGGKRDIIEYWHYLLTLIKRPAKAPAIIDESDHI